MRGWWRARQQLRSCFAGWQQHDAKRWRVQRRLPAWQRMPARARVSLHPRACTEPQWHPSFIQSSSVEQQRVRATTRLHSRRFVAPGSKRAPLWFLLPAAPMRPTRTIMDGDGGTILCVTYAPLVGTAPRVPAVVSDWAVRRRRLGCASGLLLECELLGSDVSVHVSVELDHSRMGFYTFGVEPLELQPFHSGHAR
jgi:hypothetical protein